MPTAAATPPVRPQVAVVAVAGTLIAAGVVALAVTVDGRLAALLVVGGLAGLALHHALFGFAASTRRFLVDRRGAGVRAQLLMIGLASVAFVPLLAGGSAFGQGLGGALAPVGVSVALGAFLFGIGMQLGGGCASGTLSGAGTGSLRMAITLGAFIAGSVIGTAHLPWWLSQPRLPALSIPSLLGWPTGLAVQLAAIGLLILGALYLERRRHGAHEPLVWGAGSDWRERLLHGGWPLAWGALALALLNLATLLIAGHPWSVTWGFALWGASLADALGFGIAEWTFWQWPGPARKLEAGVAQDTVSVMNVGLILGALLGAALAGRFAARGRLSIGAVASAVIGGLLLGYGARLAFGCNIGALFSGIASGSVHGWLWLLAALPGAALGARLRPLFGLDRAAAPAAEGVRAS
ncbi:MAG: YeeE/YedE family protein [Rhodospirillaceae bacterium]|nr:YeeE/YedE family protein [Rhodospirillaceae bacterium]